MKKSGEVFRLSDYGVVQDFVVNSIDKRTHRENIDGRPGAVNYGTYDGDRTITVPFIFKAHDLHDYAHLRDELYGILDDDEPFYIREMRRVNYLQYEFVDFGEGHKWSPGTDDRYVNGKQILVRLNSVITPEQEFKNGKVDLEFISDELPYFETIYTTLELHDTGYSATAEKYGLVDNIDDEKVQYRFEPGRSSQSLINESFEYGFLSSSTGSETTSTRNIITSDYVRVYPGIEYEFEDTGTHPTLNYWWIYEYDDSNNFIKASATNIGDNRLKHTFIAEGSKLRFMAQANSGVSIDLAGVGDDILPILRRDAMNNSFNVYNAGNVSVEPESMMLDIFVSTVRSDNNFTIRNKTTGEEIILKRASFGSHFRIRDMAFSFGSFTNIFRDTNRRFISLAPGDNEFEVSGGTFNHIRFDFKYLYK